jgi:hypothetical protein
MTPNKDPHTTPTKPTIEEQLAGTEAGKIWDEIKNRPIDMFAIPGQVVSQHAFPSNIDHTKLYLTAKATSVLPALETALGSNYVVELAGRFVTVSRAPFDPTK